MSQITELVRIDFEKAADEYLASEEFRTVFERIKSWREEVAVLATNPPNHIGDFEDGTMHIVLGQQNVDATLSRHADSANSDSSFAIIKQGRFHQIVEALINLKGESQREAAMAFYVRATNGALVSSTEQWKRVAGKCGSNYPATLENPMYRLVCERILRAFLEHGWV
jgi:hypothetical protein